MHLSNKGFLDFFPAFLSAEDKKVVDDARVKLNNYKEEYDKLISEHAKKDENKRNSLRSHHNYPIEKVRELRSAHGVDIINDNLDEISTRIFKEYSLTRKIVFSSAEEAFTAYLHNLVRVYGWFSDVLDFKKNLTQKEILDSNTASSYWFFMEWQSDALNFGQALFAMNNYKFPKNLDLDLELISKAFNIIIGREDVNNLNAKHDMTDRLKTLVNTSADWAWGDIIWETKDKFPHSSQKSFEDQFHFFVALSAFWEEENIPEDAFKFDDIFHDVLIAGVYQKANTFNPIVPVSHDSSGLLYCVTESILLLKKIIENTSIAEKDENSKFNLDEKKKTLQLLGIILLCMKNELDVSIDGKTFNEMISLCKDLGLPIIRHEYEFNDFRLFNAPLFMFLSWINFILSVNIKEISAMSADEHKLVQYFYEISIIAKELNLKLEPNSTLENVKNFFPLAKDVWE